MKRSIGLGVVVLIIATFAFGPASAQDDSQATISALQTNVTDLEATVDARGDKINAQRTQIAGLKTEAAINAPTATATQETRVAISAEPQILADGLELLYYYTVEDGYSISLLGEMKNTTDRWLDSPYLRIVLLDGDGNIVGTTDASPALITIGPGEAMPFEAGIYEIERTEWQREEIVACDWPDDLYVGLGYGESPTLSLQNVEEVEKSADRLSIKGEVLNSGSDPIEGVHVHALVYLPNGRYAGEVATQIDVAIPAGKTARFTIESYGVPGVNSSSSSFGLGKRYTYQLSVAIEPWLTMYSC